MNTVSETIPDSWEELERELGIWNRRVTCERCGAKFHPNGGDWCPHCGWWWDRPFEYGDADE